MEQGTPVKLSDGTVGSFVSDVGNGKILVDVPVEKEKEGPDGNKTGHLVAGIERIEIPTSEIETNFEERNKQVDRRNGNWWYTNQHGTRISPIYDANDKELP